jgi:uncharacterized RDD family membrane protein YckC
VPPLDNTTEVETPERIRFRYRTAGPVRRGLAWGLDLLVRLALLVVVIILLGIIAGVSASELGNASKGFLLVTTFVLEWGYFVAFETMWSGSSPGKRVFGLRVVKEGGFPLGFTDSLLRNLLRAADFLPVGYVVGVTVMAGDRRFRRLGDRVAGTMVVVEDRVHVSEPLRLEPPAAPGELDALPARVILSAAEREALELFLRRRDLAPARRLELAEMIAPHLAARLGITSGNSVRFLALLYERARPPEALR